MRNITVLRLFRPQVPPFVFAEMEAECYGFNQVHAVVQIIDQSNPEIGTRRTYPINADFISCRYRYDIEFGGRSNVCDIQQVFHLNSFRHCS